METNSRYSRSEARALASFTAIAVWSLFLSMSVRPSFLNWSVVTVVRVFTAALVCVVPLYAVRSRISYLAGAVIGVAYMVLGALIDPPAPWVSNPSVVSVFAWSAVYVTGIVAVYYSLKAFSRS